MTEMKDKLLNKLMHLKYHATDGPMNTDSSLVLKETNDLYKSINVSSCAQNDLSNDNVLEPDISGLFIKFIPLKEIEGYNEEPVPLFHLPMMGL